MRASGHRRPEAVGGGVGWGKGGGESGEVRLCFIWRTAGARILFLVVWLWFRDTLPTNTLGRCAWDTSPLFPPSPSFPP